MPMPDRIERAAHETARARLDALVITPSPDMLWLAGYDPPPLERPTCLVIRPGRATALVVPELERPLAEEAGLGEVAEIVSWGETVDPYRLVARIVGKASRIGCTDRMWSSHLLRLQAALPKTHFTPASGVLGPLRAVKDADELGRLQRAGRYADDTFGRVLRTRFESATEREIAGRLSDLLTAAGNDQVTFLIVGSGPNAASPHHHPGDRTIQSGDAVVMDFGGKASGYCSDFSRTVTVRKPTAQLEEVHAIVREAQEQAFRAVSPGVPAEEVDRVARDVIESAGYGDLFVHRTGHGIGLEEHEAPYIVEGNKEPLQPGMCFSIEPGIYLPGKLGVRIEDIVAVTEDGAERFNRASRDLEVVT